MPTTEVKYTIDLSKIWDVILKVISSPSFITLIAPFIVSLLGRFFPGLDPTILNGLVQLLVQILPLIFAAEMGTRYVMAGVERSAQIKAGWTPDAAGKMQAPATLPKAFAPRAPSAKAPTQEVQS